MAAAAAAAQKHRLENEMHTRLYGLLELCKSVVELYFVYHSELYRVTIEGDPQEMEKWAAHSARFSISLVVPLYKICPSL